MKTPTIDSFFKRKTTEILEKDSHDHAPKLRRLEIEDDFDIDKLERDPGLRPQIWKYPIGKRDEVRRAYINFGPYQPMLNEYPKSVERQSRSFQSSWYTRFAAWLEYSNASCKRNDQLRDAHASNMAFLLAIGDLESGKGINQLGSLQRAGDTRWTSHFKSISSLIKMFSATCEVLMTIKSDGNTHSQRGEASSVYETMTSFYFVFIMHLMREVLDITSCLCNALQLQSQDILNAMSLVSTSKSLLQKLRDDGWSKLVEKVRTFCEKVNIEVPDFSTHHETRRRASHQQNRVTVEHYYRVDIFYTVIDSQLQELNNRFNDDSVELIILSSALDPKELRTTLRVDDICKLVEKFYPLDFDEDERTSLRMELQHFELVRQLPEFNTLTEISELCRWLMRTRKSNMFPLLYKVITLILTLPVSTATAERSFSRMNLVKNALRNKMEDDFLSDCLVVNIEKEIAKMFSTDSIIDDFRDLETRRSLF
ncbi:unnamed protein product [Rhodiola kirilowii]